MANLTTRSEPHSETWYIIDVCMMVSVCFHKDLDGPWRRLFFLWFHPPYFRAQNVIPEENCPQGGGSTALHATIIQFLVQHHVRCVSAWPGQRFGVMEISFLSKRHAYIARLGRLNNTGAMCNLRTYRMYTYTHALHEFELIVEYTAINCST